MKNTLLLVSIATIFLSACDNSDKVVTRSMEAPAVVIQAPEATGAPEVVEDQYDADGILICEENSEGYCVDETLDDLRTQQRKEKWYADNAAYTEEVNPEQGDVIEDYELDDGTNAYYGNQSEPEVVRETGPVQVWGRDLSNYMTKYPRETEAKYGDAQLIITGMVNQVFSDGVSLGGTFVDISVEDVYKNDTITVYCNGVQAGGSWGISAIAFNCSY